MKICIDIPGSVTHGLWSPERGESRWAQNWASFLASLGHEVTCICTPGLWGACPPVPNVTLVQRPDPNKVYDIFMHAAWWEGRDIFGVKSRVYVHHHYCFEPYMAKESHIQKNHVISCAYVQSIPYFMGEWNPFAHKTFCLPIPIAAEYGKSHFEKNTLTWAAKEIFLDRHAPGNTQWYKCGKSVIEAMKEQQVKSGYNCNFLMWDHLNPKSHKAVHEYGVDKIIESINPKQIYGIMPYREVFKFIEESKMSLPVISPGGSMIESIMLGVLPLAWQGSPLDQAAKDSNWILSTGATDADIKRHIDMVLNSRDLYDSILARFQEALAGHLYSSSLKYFNMLVDWMEKNCE